MPLKKIKRFKQLITKGYKWRIKSEIWIRSSEYNGAKIESQIENLKATESEKIYQEKFTGTTTERPEF